MTEQLTCAECGGPGSRKFANDIEYTGHAITRRGGDRHPFRLVRKGHRGDVVARILSNVIDNSDPNACHISRYSKGKGGYANVQVDGRSRIASRVLAERLLGPIPEGNVVDHLCNEPACVNPRHYAIVTQRDNILRSSGMAARRAQQTHCKRGHEFTPENTYSPPSFPTRRECWTCKRAARLAPMRKQDEAANPKPSPHAIPVAGPRPAPGSESARRVSV